MKVIKSPIRYPGGKSRIAFKLANLIPAGITEVREPFCGGASFTLAAAQLNPNRNYIISDIFFPLVAFWFALKFFPEKTIRKITEIYEQRKAGKALHKRLMDEINTRQSITQTAAIFFALNRMSFSGLTCAGRFSKSALNGRFTHSSIERVANVSKLMSFITVLHGDYKPVLKAPGENVFIFLDPPYFGNKNSRLYGHNGDLHANFNHIEFCDQLKQCKHYWLMTIDDIPENRAIFKDYFITPLKIAYGMNNVGGKKAKPGNELLVSNYDITPLHGDRVQSEARVLVS